MTPQKEQALDEAHEKFIQLSLGDLPLELAPDFVAKSIMGYGTAKDEKILSLKEYEQVLLRQRQQSEGLDIQFAATPVFRSISATEDAATIVTEFTLNLLVEDNRHKVFVRMTTVMEYIHEHWIVVHVHASKPDDVSTTEDTWHINEWKRKNEELQRLIEEKTADLQYKNRELEIEAALERVRAKMMAMHKSEELRQVIGSVFKQLQNLGFDAPACALIIYNNDLSAEHWMSGFSQEIYPESYKIPYNDHPYFTDLLRAWQQGVPFQQFAFEGDLKTSYADWLFEHSDFKNLPEDFKNEVKSPARTIISDAFMRYGMLEVISGECLSEEKVNIVRRFAKVFEQTYTRFLDLRKAEAQAREANIEAALEKVRSGSLAMHHSSELQNVVRVVFEKLEELGFGMGIVSINTFDDNLKETSTWAADAEDSYTRCFNGPYNDYPPFKNIYDAREEGVNFLAKVYPRDEKDAYWNFLFSTTNFKNVPDKVKNHILESECYAYSIAITKNSFLMVPDFTGKLISEDQKEILLRFSRVFEQAYIRFLDLQKAEAQAREAQIEVALEKVRSRTMAMQHSDELLDVVTVVREKLQELGVVMDGGVTILTFIEGSRDADHWVYNPDRFSTSTCSRVPYIDHPLYRDLFIAKERGMEFFSRVSSFEETNSFWKYAFENTDFRYWSDEVKNWILASESFAYSIAFAKNSAITVNSLSGELISQEQSEVLKRFANVFDQAYVRFLDLQKAEAQAREAEIELALERVRARTMAMQRQDELPDVLNLLAEQLIHLGFDIDVANFGNGLSYGDWDLWMFVAAGNPGEKTIRVFFPWFNHPYFQQTKEGLDDFLKKGIDLHVALFSKEEKDSFLDYCFTNTSFRDAPADIKQAAYNTPGYTFSSIYLKENWVTISKYDTKPFTTEQHSILRRFANAFGQAYTRFLDLQKAEAQAREAKIEAELEKVRSRSLAMHHSNELLEVVKVVLEQMAELHFDTIVTSINIYDDNLKETTTYIAAFDRSFPVCYKAPYNDYSCFTDPMNAREKGEEFFAKVYTRKEKDPYWNFLLTQSDFRYMPDEAKALVLENENYAVSAAITKHASLLIPDGSGKLVSEDEKGIMIRFARVFEQAYIRFLDLQKAEAQAREAKIEAALERVRSKTMAMHSSADIGGAMSTMFEELMNLGVGRSAPYGVVIYDDAFQEELWQASADVGGAVLLVAKFDVRIHTKLLEGYQRWKNGDTSYSLALAGEELKNFYKTLNLAPSYPAKFDLEHLPERRITNLFYFDAGGLYIFTDEPLNADAEQLFIRFAGVFNLTYRRFLDLQKAEASAKEAVRQASLDRVRAEIASMRTTADLERITPLVWRELTTLGVPFIRCGVFIMDEKEEQIHIYLSTPDGKAIAAFQIPLSSEGQIQKVLENWKHGEIFIDHWDAATFSAWTKSLVEHGTIKAGEKYITEKPPENLYLHFLPFLQGMLYVGNTQQLSEDDIKLVQTLADAFSTAYARYEDFNKLESAKEKIEKTLTDLKSAQARLIQSEKMASLGELTAGIAHEIQNPLNFVNNFSDVNKELLEELKNEAEKGNMDEVKAIADDVIDNEEKINHHGKRADAIVKGMLQHSRANGGQKELADINALADEYLRLAYHGLRAKDKDFNADFKINFDESIGEIEVVSQDIGRVLLNLYNNAFYAVNEKNKAKDLEGFQNLQGLNDYQPTVIVTTKRIGDKVEIVVKDNGSGIPQKVVDKIFQPFFTTKPTGQGTGLGLSLSYDIIKAHGSEIKVETKDGEGAEFMFYLPLS